MSLKLVSVCAGLLIAPGALAQDYWLTDTTNPSGGTSVAYQHTLHYRMSTTLPARIPVPKPITNYQVAEGGDLLCNHDHMSPGMRFLPWDLTNRLTNKVKDRSAAELRSLVQETQRAADRSEKLKTLFRTNGDGAIYTVGAAGITGDTSLRQTEVEQLARGEAVTLELTRGWTCLTPQQVDGVIAEATRVIGLLIQSLEKGPLTKPQSGAVTTQGLR